MSPQQLRANSLPTELVTCLRTPTERMFKMLRRSIVKYGYRPECDRLWMYAPGELPILLVAHIDTVHRVQPPSLHFDPYRKVLWAPEGLGADDRAGVWAILEILGRGYRPHVLFTDEEERGGHGAASAGKQLDPAVRFIIEMDRKGDNDCVFYDCISKRAVKYVESFGFREAGGSFTDICWLMPSFGIAGVNLSIGYYAQHTHGEYMRIDEAARTIKRVCKMLDRPPLEPIPYEEVKRLPIPKDDPKTAWPSGRGSSPAISSAAASDWGRSEEYGSALANFQMLDENDSAGLAGLENEIVGCAWCGDPVGIEDTKCYGEWLVCKECYPQVQKEFNRV